MRVLIEAGEGKAAYIRDAARSRIQLALERHEARHGPRARVTLDVRAVAILTGELKGGYHGRSARPLPPDVAGRLGIYLFAAASDPGLVPGWHITLDAEIARRTRIRCDRLPATVTLDSEAAA